MKRILSALLLVLCLCLPVATASAYTPLGDACSTGTAAAQSSVCGNAPAEDPQSLIKKVSSIVAIVAGVVAVIVIAVGGLQYVVSGGDPQKTANARNAIIGGAIGLAIIATAQGIIIFVLTKIQ